MAVVTTNGSAQSTWSGHQEGKPTVKVMPVPGSDDRVALLDHVSSDPNRPFNNLARYRRDGSVVWRAELPDLGVDSYVDFELSGELKAWSWSCYRVTLDLDSGRITSRTFTK